MLQPIFHFKSGNIKRKMFLGSKYMFEVESKPETQHNIVLNFEHNEQCSGGFIQTFTCSKSTIETLEKGVKYDQS